MSVRACNPKKKVRAYEGAAVGLFNVIRAGTAGAGSEEVRVRRCVFAREEHAHRDGEGEGREHGKCKEHAINHIRSYLRFEKVRMKEGDP